jgi:hypothetical protein
MNYWNGTTWVSVPPGNHGQFLVFCNGIPTWGVCVPHVTTSTVTDILQLSATSGGIVTSDGGSYVHSKGVVYDSISNPTLSNHYTMDGDGIGLFSSYLTNLIPNTTYFVRAYASNFVGTSYGGEVSFTTLALSLPQATTSPISNITPSGAITGGNITSDGGSMVSERGVVYDTSTNPTLSNNFTTDGTGTGVFTSQLTGLSPLTTYYVRAYATNSVGTSYGNELSLLTNVTIGTNYAGGIVFYIDGTGQHGLVCAPYNQGDFQMPTALSICSNLNLNGYSGWYLPSLGELLNMRSSLGIGAFPNGVYWSSSPGNISWTFWAVTFASHFYGNGTSQESAGASVCKVRAVRAF